MASSCYGLLEPKSVSTRPLKQKTMKKMNYLLALVFLVSSAGAFAQKVSVDTGKSKVEWLGKKIGGQHDGTVNLKSGSLELKGDKIAAGDFVIDMTTIVNTDQDDAGYRKKLEGHLKSDDFFGVSAHPTAKFVVASSTAFKKNTASVTGNLTIKGKTEKVTFDVSRSGNSYTAKIEVDRSKFDVRYGSNSFFDNLGDKAIDDIFTMTVNLVTK